MSLHANITQAVAAAVELRHELHRIPELGFQEFKTAEAIRAALNRLDLNYVAGVPGAETATIAVLGDMGKPCVALRADIDALPIIEANDLPYASRHPGRMHACGHDGHTSILLATADVLRTVTGELPVCVKLIWQPAEEGGGGGERLVQAGVLDGRIGPKVSAIFGLHGWPALPLGTVSTRAGAVLAATDTFAATFVGRGGHGAYPHLGRDSIAAASEAVLSLQQFVSRELDPTDSAVVTVGKFHAGTATNVIPDEAVIEGTARTLRDDTRQAIRASLERRCRGVAQANDCQLRFAWHVGYPATVNDPAMADYTATIARRVVGPDRYLPLARPSMGGEDFAYYLQQRPGCFFFLGLDPAAGPPASPLHTDRYDFNDAAIEIGVRMFVELVSNFAVR